MDDQRRVFYLTSPQVRHRVCDYVREAPAGWRVEVKAPKRTLMQNDRMWAMLTDISKQAEHHGRKYNPNQWKVIFLNALGRETQFIPTLDGSTFIPYGQSSSDLSVKEMTAMIELLFQYGAEHGIEFKEPEPIYARAA